MKYYWRLRYNSRILAHILKRTTFVMLFACCTSAGSVLAQKTNLTLRLTEVPLISFFKSVEKNSDYIFFFNKDIIDQEARVSIDVKDEPVLKVLDRVLPAYHLGYMVKGRQIIISKKGEKPGQDTSGKEKSFRVSGSVVDASGEALPGVSIYLEGRQTGTVSDYDGSFDLEISGEEKAVLLVSYVGFQSQRHLITPENNQLSIVLKEMPEALDEVVVVGYGTQKKLNMTGAVTSISGDALMDRPIGNIAQGLQGMVPNLNITFNSGQPNTPAAINIRGNTSLNGGSALILVDGVEVSDLSFINPQDIENISVLKDASTAAVYGPRGAFGVLLITTKKGGRNQQLRVSYSNNLSWNTPARLPEMPRADVWCRAINREMDYATPGDYYFSDRFLELLDAHIQDPANNPGVIVDTEGIQDPRSTPSNPGWAYVSNTNWLKEFYRNSAFMQQHNASISGGTEKNNYYASIGYKDQGGIFRYGNDTYSRFNATFNFDSEITRWLDFGVSFKFNDMRSDEPYMETQGSDEPYAEGRSRGAETWYYEVYRMYPTLPVYLPNGDFAGITIRKGNTNVLGKMATAGRRIDKAQDAWYSANFTLKPLEGLLVKGDFTHNRYYTQIKSHKKIAYQTMPDRDGGSVTEEANAPNGVSNYNGENEYNIFNIWADYKKTFRNHNLQLMVGYNQEKKRYHTSKIVVNDLFDNELPVAGMASTIKSTTETLKAWSLQGIFFRINYDYKSRYLLELNGRYDGSSKYADGHKWGFFPSASVGWRISEEKFMQGAGFVDNLKIRASVGSLGNQITDGYYQHFSYLSSQMQQYVINGEIINGLRQPTLASTDITWEKVISKNIGLDWNILGNRLYGTFDFYVRDINGMVRSKTYPAVLGASGGKENIADMRTVGWELELGWRSKINNLLGSPLHYNLSVGLSDYQAEITKYDNPTGSLVSGMYYEGQKLGEIWGYETEGFIKDDVEASEMNTIQKFIYHRWKPGDIRYRDLNGDGVIDRGTLTLDNPGDQRVIGNTTPRYRFNIMGSLEWHNFNFDIFFEGVCKRDLMTSSDQFWGHSRGIYNSNITQYHIDNTWTYENPDAYFPRPSSMTHNKQAQTKYLLNAAYIRLKSISLGYSLPKKWTEKLHMEHVKIYVSGMNLWEKTGLLPFMTPDIVDNIASEATSPNSGKQYAFMRSFSCGVNLTF